MTRETVPDPNPPQWERIEEILEGLLKISNYVGSVLLLDDILARLVRITSEQLNVPVCSVYLFDETGERLLLRSNVGFEHELIGKASFQLGRGMVGWVAQTGQSVALADANGDERYEPLPSTMEMEYKAYLAAPLRIQNEVIGVMTARKQEAYPFNQGEILFFETAAKQMAIVIEKARMYHEKVQAERLAAVAVSLSGVAHYIKNVLLTMQGGEYLVEQGLLREDLTRAREGWELLKRSNMKIRSLVENILNYCRKSELNFHPVDFNNMIRDLLDHLANNAQERGVELVAELDDRLGDVWIDPESFYDVLLNLLTNALDAIPDQGRQGRISVQTRRLDNRNQVRVDVIDNGMGISEENRDKIFNLFFTTKGQKGTGIGLAATRKIIEDHGGTIELHSQVDHGTQFQIFLPIEQNRPVDQARDGDEQHIG